MKQLLLLLVTVSLNVFGQLMMKRGMSSVGAITGDMSMLVESLSRAIMNPFVLAGVASYGISTIFWLILLSRVELSYAYHALSMGYVLITLVSAFVLGEQVSAMRWAGVFIIVTGVILVTRG